VDLNADLGEVADGVPTDDAGLVEVVTSANVACGFHSGDATTMRRVSGLCVERGVAIGAQVSYRDREGFGRRFLDVDPAALAGGIEHLARQPGERTRLAAAASRRAAATASGRWRSSPRRSSRPRAASPVRRASAFA